MYEMMYSTRYWKVARCKDRLQGNSPPNHFANIYRCLDQREVRLTYQPHVTQQGFFSIGGSMSL